MCCGIINTIEIFTSCLLDRANQISLLHQVPELATYLLISFFPQLPFVLYLAYVQPVMFPVDPVLGTFMIIFLVSSTFFDCKLFLLDLQKHSLLINVCYLLSWNESRCKFVGISFSEFLLVIISSCNFSSVSPLSGCKFGVKRLNLWGYARGKMMTKTSSIMMTPVLLHIIEIIEERNGQTWTFCNWCP